MICTWMSPDLLATGMLVDGVSVIRDGPVNLYVLKAPAGLVCIDSGWRSATVRKGFESLGLNVDDVTDVLLTHLHWDHARGHCFYPKARVFVGDREKSGLFVKRDESGRCWTLVSDGQDLSVAGLHVRVVSTPGHTRGSVSYLEDDRFLFTGDAVSLRDGQAVPFPSMFNHDAVAMGESIRKLAALKRIKGLFTGHHGVARDVDRAFHAWRAASYGGGGSEA